MPKYMNASSMPMLHQTRPDAQRVWARNCARDGKVLAFVPDRGQQRGEQPSRSSSEHRGEVNARTQECDQRDSASQSDEYDRQTGNDDNRCKKVHRMRAIVLQRVRTSQNGRGKAEYA